MTVALNTNNRKIVIFHTIKTPKMFAPPSARRNFLSAPPPNLKSWIRPCNPSESTAAGYSAVIIVLQTDKSVKLVSPVLFSVRYRHCLMAIYSTV